MGEFIDDDFLLSNDAACRLYHEHAERMPIIDYHCHLDPQAIAEDRRFGSITQAWLEGDHYKWRAMRANGIDERYITGGAPDYEKFSKWAETVPHTMRGPLYHWTHLELVRLFGVHQILKPATCRSIYDACNDSLSQAEFSARSLMVRCGVQTVCTTDDPADSLAYHQALARDANFTVRVLPTWRPDRLLAVDDPKAFNTYVDRIALAADVEIVSLDDLMDALNKRHGYFAQLGCRLSDHGLDTFPDADYTEAQMRRAFDTLRRGERVDETMRETFRCGMLTELAMMDARRGWVQQFHLGPIRNPNHRMYGRLGPDTGYDAIDDQPMARAGHRFFDRLVQRGGLAKTILYNLNPKDYEVLAAMAYSFNDGSCEGQMQLGAAWWFLDHEAGIRRQLDVISALGLLSRFVGMLTDSRSFLSYPRHEYFRRILCDVLGADIQSGRLPQSEMASIGDMVERICYGNAKQYFDF